MTLTGLSDLKVPVDKIYREGWTDKKIAVSMLRLDTISASVPGNKLFKLYYFLQDAITSGKKVITFGGAYSNHLAAAAAACKQYNIQSIGLVRGEKPAVLSHTLSYCLQQGMQLEYLTRDVYKQKENEEFLESLFQLYGDHILIPEGGFSEKGATGAAKIVDCFMDEGYTHICCPVGTAATMAGLLSASRGRHQIIGFSALKTLNIEDRILYLTGSHLLKNYQFISDYHFGGFARKTKELIDFINRFYEKHAIPLDFVYTAKMMFGVTDLIQKGFFAPGSNILCVHTGGLQGNASLTPGVLNF